MVDNAKVVPFPKGGVSSTAEQIQEFFAKENIICLGPKVLPVARRIEDKGDGSPLSVPEGDGLTSLTGQSN
jgi:hypothetical protein